MSGISGGFGAGPGTKSFSPLLHAWNDPLANLKVHSSCVKLADLDCDGDSKLCVCDLDKKLKIYKGTTLAVEYAILDNPVALCIIHSELSLPRIPSIAVAAGSHVFIYRQLRPYRKWTCPFVDISPVEEDIWSSIKTDSLTVATAVKRLVEARDSGVRLSARSMDLITLDSDAARAAYLADMKDIMYAQSTLITCMEVLKKDTEDGDGITLLVVGTEAGQLYVLPQDPVNSTYLCKVQLPSTPTILSVSGLFDVEWRITVLCRDGRMYNVKSGEVRSTAVLSGSVTDLGSQAIAAVRQEKNLWVATMDKVVNCYSVKGKRLKGIVLNEDVSELCVMGLKRTKVSYLLLVALVTGKLCIYRELSRIYSFDVDAPISALCYGSYGREENALVIVHAQGTLTIKMWKRAADADSLNTSAGPPPEQDIPLPVPKKTKLYVEQTQREREKAPDIHRAFQRDLCKLRLTTARAYVKTLTDGLMGATAIGSNDIRLQIQVQGLGPKFLLKISLQNASTQPILQTHIVFSFDPNLYVMGHDLHSRQSVVVPILLPGPKQLVETQVLSIDPQGRAGQILVLLYHLQASAASNNSMPMLSASVRMPAAEPAVM
mmetsp:Transcript_13797/g.22981  ORF Transcript_13797/g.22981 Transcript_13797/m.22981 type:complete len:603 (+) Transcript_13797:119-1927(+)|eukprot:CAMPEP_0174963588 /NCGR_PEP_ID=MMETSP0004_2-20121128/5412_1 /TAXON_ID=420556 /ORGANISM="Ochromonas sp., Strain CCMP1393" /LENGTH=602 /DNA_ID=CAMNT_0016212227 /DNA_START=113 /DNA_END=1921 /DNA_ORIENTATION=+